MQSGGLICDDREDERLITELKRFDIPVHVMRLEHGDVYWEGNGPDGRLLVGLERKRLLDLIACIKDRRLAGSQLVGMWNTFDRVELVAEGPWRPDDEGMIQVPIRGGWEPLFFKRESFTYRQVDGYLQTLHECGGVSVWRTGSVAETAHMINSRWHWWNDKAYEQHGAHKAVYSTDPEMQRRGRAVLHQGTPSPVCQTAAQWPNIDSKAWSLDEQYGSIHELVTGRPMTDSEFAEGVKRWRDTYWTDSAGKQKHFGLKTSTEIMEYIRGVSTK